MTALDHRLDPAPPPERVPTLTEVIDAVVVDGGHRVAAGESGPWAEGPSPIEGVSAAVPESIDHGAAGGEADALVRLLDAAMARVDDDGDDRLRAALQPLIERFTDGLIAAVRSDLRDGLASSLRDRAIARTPLPASPPPDPHGDGAPYA